jgi:predicted deacylase
VSVVFTLEAPYRDAYRLHRLTFGQGGPSVAIVAGIHGNEVNGIYACNLLAAVLRMRRPNGTVHLLPCVNSVGAAEGRKRWPFDDRDINAAFPGRPDGIAVERIAHAVLAATEADVCVDVQSGSPQVHEHPHVRAPVSGAELACARATELPIVWRRAGDRFQEGLVAAWGDAGRKAIVVRGGRGAALDIPDAKLLASGLVRLLTHVGVLPPQEVAGVSLEVDHVEDYRSGAGGFFVPEVRPGDAVAAGALLGVVRSPIGGDPIETIQARRAGRVLAVRVYPMAHAQELLVRVAEETTG